VPCPRALARRGGCFVACILPRWADGVSQLPARADGLPTLSLCLIARDEEATLPHLLASVEGAFDEVILVDTGSRDSTIRTFRMWAGQETRRAAERGEMFSFMVQAFEWRDDFAAARKHADALATGDWIVWADADDVIRGAENLRPLAAQAQPDLAAYVAEYNYARDEHGNCICRLRRERLVRRFRGFWAGRVHEAQRIEGGSVAHVARDVLEWWHHKPLDHTVAANGRNLRILRSWVKDEPENPRVLMYLGTEELARHRTDRAIGYFRRYLKLKTGWDEERAQVHRKLAIALDQRGRHDEAIATALEAVRLLPTWPDSYLTLAEQHYALREPDKAIHWARQVLEHGVPETLLIINELDYQLAPHVILAGAHGALGDLDAAIEHAEHALELDPGHPAVGPAYMGWRARRKREQTARTFLAAAEMLVTHDEQLKARAVLDQVPHFAIDHPAVVAMRSQLAERIHTLEHAPEGEAQSFLAEEHVDGVCAQLPRARFLAEALRERAGEPTGWTVVRTRLGEFRTRFGDSMVHFLTAPGGYETEIEDLLREHVEPGMTVACVGANIGYFTRLLAQLVGGSGRSTPSNPTPATPPSCATTCPRLSSTRSPAWPRAGRSSCASTRSTVATIACSPAAAWIRASASTASRSPSSSRRSTSSSSTRRASTTRSSRASAGTGRRSRSSSTGRKGSAGAAPPPTRSSAPTPGRATGGGPRSATRPRGTGTCSSRPHDHLWSSAALLTGLGLAFVGVGAISLAVEVLLNERMLRDQLRARRRPGRR
jgi:tetratricopeptide (TPR) repeat protein